VYIPVLANYGIKYKKNEANFKDIMFTLKVTKIHIKVQNL